LSSRVTVNDVFTPAPVARASTQLEAAKQTPHGGTLVDLLLKTDEEKAAAMAKCSKELQLTPRQLCDVELIMNQVPKDNNIQILLYSATIPDWIRSIVRTFLKPDYVTVDLVTSSKDAAQTALLVQHLAIESSGSTKLDALADIVKCYTQGGKVIVFCEKKHEANDVALSSSISKDCQVLHGDISQQQRDVTLASFREGVFNILVATDLLLVG